MKAILVFIAFALCLAANSFGQSQPANNPNGSFLSVPAIGSIFVLTNKCLTSNPVKVRWVQVATNSPADLVMVGVPVNLPLTNSYIYSYTTTGGFSTIVTTNIFTNTISWTTATNVLTTVAAGTPTNGWPVMRLGPGWIFFSDFSGLFNGGYIGVSATGTNKALVYTGDLQ